MRGGLKSDTYLKLDIDFEGKSRRELLWILCKSLMLPNPRFFLTRRGFHIVDRSVESTRELRLMFGDDPMRVDVDEAKKRLGLPYNILFTWKNGFLVCEIEFDILWRLIELGG